MAELERLRRLERDVEEERRLGKPKITREPRACEDPSAISARGRNANCDAPSSSARSRRRANSPNSRACSRPGSIRDRDASPRGRRSASASASRRERGRERGRERDASGTRTGTRTGTRPRVPSRRTRGEGYLFAARARARDGARPRGRRVDGRRGDGARDAEPASRREIRDDVGRVLGGTSRAHVRRRRRRRNPRGGNRVRGIPLVVRAAHALALALAGGASAALERRRVDDSKLDAFHRRGDDEGVGRFDGRSRRVSRVGDGTVHVDGARASVSARGVRRRREREFAPKITAKARAMRRVGDVGERLHGLASAPRPKRAPRGTSAGTMTGRPGSAPGSAPYRDAKVGIRVGTSSAPTPAEPYGGWGAYGRHAGGAGEGPATASATDAGTRAAATMKRVPAQVPTKVPTRVPTSGERCSRRRARQGDGTATAGGGGGADARGSGGAAAARDGNDLGWEGLPGGESLRRNAAVARGVSWNEGYY